MDHLSTFWCGDDRSLQAYLLALAKPTTEAAMLMRTGQSSQQAAQTSRLVTQVGDIAVIAIYGPLVDSANADVNEWRGVTGYPEIRQALVESVNNPNVKGILLDIKSGGGTVSGVQDTADLIASVAKVKPVRAHTDGLMASAAYWLAASSDSISAGSISEVGSIGVITVHQDMTKMLHDYGITATVMRAGEFKALGHPMEPLSEKARAEIQASLDHMYTLFMSHVAESRGVPYATADAKMGQGKVFLGTKALEAGLVDSINTFDAALSKMQGEVDKKNNSPKYGANLTQGSPVKHTLTEQQIAAIQAGASAGTGSEATEAELAAQAAAEAEAKAKADAEAKAAAEAGATQAAASAADTNLVAYLQGQLAEAQKTNLELTLKARDEDAKVATLEANLAGFRAIAQASDKHIRVALSLPAVAHATDAELLADHAAVKAQFEQKFKVGGVAAVSSSDTSASKEGAGAAVDPLRMARIEATKP